MNELNALLRRHLRRLGLSESAPPADAASWRTFLERISQTCDDVDRERYTTERAFAISSREMQQLYERLRQTKEHELQQERDKLAQAVALRNAAFDTMTEGVLVVGADRHVLSLNTAFVRMWRIPDDIAQNADDGAVLARGLEEVENREAFLAKVLHLYENPEEYSADEVRFRDGRVLDRYSAPVRDASGQVCARLWIFREVTEQRRADAAVRAAREEAETANRAKSEFLMNMSHELRTPLNSIVGFARVLEGGVFGDLNERQREYLNFILLAGEHMSTLVNDLLDLRRIEERRDALGLAEHATDLLLDAAVSMVKPLIGERGHAFELCASEDVRAVRCDGRAFVQVMVNLLSNAAKYTDPGGRITLSVRSDGEDAIFDVADTGIGIAEEDQRQLFTYFTQVGAKHRHGMVGSGVGLALTKALVERMDGRISVESAPGQGSHFVVRLPKAAA